MCRCDCGTVKPVITRNLVGGFTQSCGCICKEGTHTTHGGKHTRLYRIWGAMKTRCNNPNASHYHRYGGRGITVCAEWSDDFAAFRDWAMANGYQDDLTIDRIDNDKGYSPDNCRWTSQAEQGSNKQRSNHLTVNGETHTITEWSRRTGIPQSTIWKRIFEYQWTPERAIEERRVTHDKRTTRAARA